MSSVTAGAAAAVTGTALGNAYPGRSAEAVAGAAMASPLSANGGSLPWQAIELENGRHVFVDDYLVASAQNLRSTLHHPRKSDKPILYQVGSGDDNYQPYATVLYDEERRRFRMWYNTRKSLLTDTLSLQQGQTYVSYLESEDGIQWERPYKPLFEIYGFGACVLDDGPASPDPAKRYKMIYWGLGRKGSPHTDGGAAERVAFSPDGLQWTQYEGNPVTLDLWKYSPSADPQKKGNIKWRECALDCVHSTWDPIRKMYVAYVKTTTWPPDEFGYISYPGHSGRRLTSVMVSPDFIHWSTPVRGFVPEPDDFHSIEFGYIFRAKPRGNQMLIWGCILDEATSTGPGCHGVGFTVLATTTDLVHCNRMKQTWLNRVADDPNAVDHAMAWVADMVTVDDEEYIYYAGYVHGHKNFNDRTMNFARLRKDGFVSRDAGAEAGRLLTPLVRLRSERMTVNAKVRGELRLTILDQNGQPVPGFGQSDIAKITGDSTEHPVKAARQLAELKGQPARLEFSMREGELYGFELVS